MRKPNSSNAPGTQRGAALVVGLMLLVIITLLAMTGMNTASTELKMSTNERVRENAFRAAETGIEEALAVLTTLPQTNAPVVVAPQAVPGSATDTYTTTSQYMGEDEQIPGQSAGKFVAFHYNVQSTGASSLNATAQQQAGAYIIGAAGGGGENFGTIN